MKNQKKPVKGKTSAFVKTMYVISAIFAAVAVYMLIANILYIKTYTASYGMTFGDMWSEAIQYIISGCALYFAAAVIIFGMGRIMTALQKEEKEADTEETVCDTEENEDAVEADSEEEETEEKQTEENSCPAEEPEDGKDAETENEGEEEEKK